MDFTMQLNKIWFKQDHNQNTHNKIDISDVCAN
jgi:hypothetical protein